MGDLRGERRNSKTLLLGFGAVTAVSLVLSLRAASQSLPSAPSALLFEAKPIESPGLHKDRSSDTAEFFPGMPDQAGITAVSESSPPPCGKGNPAGSLPAGGSVPAQDKTSTLCTEENPLQPIIASRYLPPLHPSQKAYLATRDVIDPFNLVTIVGYSGIAIAANSHTAYGPGFPGFGRLTGYSIVEDMQGEFFGTFLIPSLARQDPRYYRMPGRPFARRLVHAVSHTVITRHDDGSLMPNYATLLTYPISAEMSNLYVPGVATNAPSTGKRIALGLATDPAGQIVAEFLPDVAKRIHIRVIFVQQILQQVAQGSTGGPVMTQ